MRSRFSAFALGLVDYLIETTFPGGPQWRTDRARWSEELRDYCEATRFAALSILKSPGDPSDLSDQAEVSFRAELWQGGQDLSFSEASRFQFVGGKWLYHSGRRL